MTNNHAGHAYTLRISDMVADERPRERLRDYGPSALSNHELLAIVISSGSQGENAISLANRALTRFSDLAALSQATLAELCELRGIGEAKGCQVLAAMELGRRAATLPSASKPRINSPDMVYNLVAADMELLEQEKLRALLLNNKNEVISNHEIYRGTVNTASIRVSEILRPAIRENCPFFIVVHNHPSGDPTPSPEDILVTRRVRESAAMMDIELLDHIVIGRRGLFVSMKSKRLGF